MSTAPAFPPNCEKAVILLSGGLDSASVLWWAEQHLGAENLFCLGVDLGNGCRANLELAVARQMADNFGAAYEQYSIRAEFDNRLGMALWMPGNGSEPQVPMIRDAVLHRRNVILASMGSALAATLEVRDVFMGFELRRGEEERDRAFLDSLNRAGDNHDGQYMMRPEISSPILHIPKEEIIDALAAEEGGMDFLKMTFSCVKPVGFKHCGKCLACAERMDSFQKSGVADPTEYA